MQASSKNMRLNAIIPTKKCKLLADKQRIVQIVINLVQNAIKFAQVGPITIRVWLDNETSQDQETASLFLQVEDKGIGIEPEEMALLFTDYGILRSGLSMNPNGVGLSLSICKQICQRLGGDIECRSEKNKGSTFTFHVQAQLFNDSNSPVCQSVTASNFNIHHHASENQFSMTNDISYLFEKMCMVMLQEPKLFNGTSLKELIDNAVTIEALETQN